MNCRIRDGATHFFPFCAAARNSARRLRTRRSGLAANLRRELLATLSATTGKNLAATLGCHARTETVAAFANQSAGLISTFHFILPSLRLQKTVVYRGMKVASQIPIFIHAHPQGLTATDNLAILLDFHEFFTERRCPFSSGKTRNPEGKRRRSPDIVNP